MVNEKDKAELAACISDLHANHGCDYRAPICCLLEAVMQYSSSELCEGSAREAAIEAYNEYVTA